MDASEPKHTQRIARPADEKAWLDLILSRLPIPILVVETGSGKVLGKNEASNRLPLDRPAELDRIGPVGSHRLLAVLASAATIPDGILVTWNGPDREASFRAFSRTLPPADGDAPLTLLTFLDSLGANERVLREAIEARDEFFSIATHELKDPLFSLQLSIQLVRHAAEKQGPIPPYLAHHLDVCARQTGRLARIIDNLLDVSRIRNDRLQLDPEAIDLSELAREVVSRFQESVQSAGTALTVSADTQVTGYFDRLKIDQVLSNLLTNALKYGTGKPVAVRISEEGEFAVLEVEDQGPGISPADQDRIFVRFERASQGHKKDSLGLGLYIVRSIAEAHGGAASVRSEVGHGATFTVRLPRARLYNRQGAADNTPSEGAE